jgi:hypothetical protein
MNTEFNNFALTDFKRRQWVVPFESVTVAAITNLPSLVAVVWPLFPGSSFSEHADSPMVGNASAASVRNKKEFLIIVVL